MERYGILPTHIFGSRDLNFAKGIMRITKGKGVDVIVNSLHGEALRRTLGCLADFGRFIEVGMRDILANSGLDMEHFAKNATFASVNVDVSNITINIALVTMFSSNRL
jgi:NADPH:quinone reductase-like Zn-dependent oxidoreductase